MQDVAERLGYWIAEVPARLDRMTEAEIARRPMPGKWSKKEIVGHLCDSAINNIPRLLRAQFESQPVASLKYKQDEWVRLQDYQDKPLEEIVDLWVALNKQLVRVIRGIPSEHRLNSCVVGNNEPVTLEWLVQDYLQHLEHHLRQIFPEGM